MANATSNLLDIFDNDTLGAYDPFADADLEADEEAPSDAELAPKAPSAEERAAQQADVAALAEKPAAERIEKLFTDMGPRRQTMLDILAYLQEPRTPEELAARVKELQKNNASVYTAANYCSMLEHAGAVTKANAQGVAFSEGGKQEPETVVVDGIEFYRPAEPPQLYWKTTPDGDATVAANNPLGRLVQLLEESGDLLPIYERILQFCDVEGGKTAKEIAQIVDDDPLVMEKPRKYAPYFTDRLDGCEAVRWTGSGWETTPVGRQGFERIGDIANAQVAAETL